MLNEIRNTLLLILLASVLFCSLVCMGYLKNSIYKDGAFIVKLKLLNQVIKTFDTLLH